MMQNESNKKYRYTKQLINLALRDGWTQKDIADACRTQQSVVSAWKKGTSQAKENQLKLLLEQYGSKLRRKAFKIYHALNKDEQGNTHARIIKVEGEVLFNFPYRNKEFCMKCHSVSTSCRCFSKTKRVMPTRRIIVHDMGRGEFCLLVQQRLLKDEYQMQFPETNIFSSVVLGQFSMKDLLNRLDSVGKIDDPDEKMQDAEYWMMHMLSRKALLEHGYPIEGVEEYLAAW